MAATILSTATPQSNPRKSNRRRGNAYPFPNGLVTGDRLHLTPALFAELDSRARAVAGHVASPLPPEGMGGNFAEIANCGDTLFYRRLPDLERRGTRHSLEDGPRGVIYLANCIDLEAFRSTERPELEWAIPTEDIYRFLLEHELAHARYRDSVLNFALNFGPLGRKGDPKVERALMCLQGNRAAAHSLKFYVEARADRGAWEALYPDKPLPVRPGAEGVAAELEAIHDKYRVIFDHYASMEPLRPVGQFPEFVPVDHVAQGFLLYSPEVCEAILTGQWPEAAITAEWQARAILARFTRPDASASVMPGNRTPDFPLFLAGGAS